jgi:A/G-specific adenine glycosylase
MALPPGAPPVTEEKKIPRMSTPRHNGSRGPAGPAAQHFQVTAAMIRRDDGRILVARRPSGGIHGGLWEFPGGKQEAGESLEACLEREIAEELSLAIHVGRLLTSVDQDYPGFGITLHLFACAIAPGAAAPPSGYRIRWVTGSELHRFSMPEADRRAVERLAAEL